MENARTKGLCEGLGARQKGGGEAGNIDSSVAASRVPSALLRGRFAAERVFVWHGDLCSVVHTPESRAHGAGCFPVRIRAETADLHAEESTVIVQVGGGPTRP